MWKDFGRLKSKFQTNLACGYCWKAYDSCIFEKNIFRFTALAQDRLPDYGKSRFKQKPPEKFFFTQDKKPHRKRRYKNFQYERHSLEVDTWSLVFQKLTILYKAHMLARNTIIIFYRLWIIAVINMTIYHNWKTSPPS